MKKNIEILVIASFLILVFFPDCRAQPQFITDYVDKQWMEWDYQSGMNAYKQGNWIDAIRVFDSVIRTNPNHTEALSYRGFCNTQAGNYDVAISDYSKLISLRPNDSAPYAGRADALYLSGKKADALKDYRTACGKGDPKACKRLKKLANILQETRVSGVSAEEFVRKGIEAYKKGDLHAAEGYFDDALLGKDYYAPAFYGNGSVYAEQGDYYEALMHYNKALALDPSYAKVFYARGRVNDKLGFMDAAIADYQAACRLEHKKSCKRLRDKAKAWEEKGLGFLKQAKAWEEEKKGLDIHKQAKVDYLQARHCFSKAIQIDVSYADPYFNRGLTWEGSNELAEAIKGFKEYTQRCDASGVNSLMKLPDKSIGYFHIGLNYEKLGHPDDAIFNYGLAIKFNGLTGSTKAAITYYYHRAKVYYINDRLREAHSDVNTACNLGDKLSCHMRDSIAEDLRLR